MRPSYPLKGHQLAITLLAGLAAGIPLSASPAQPAPVDRWQAVDAGLGRAGTTQPDGVRRYSFPRSDLKVTLDGVAIRPALALGSWIAFHPVGSRAHVMGDLVLTGGEVNAVMGYVLAAGMKVTALHNHLLRSTPPTFYMHVEGEGDPGKLAAALRAALAKSGTPLAPPASSASVAVDLDTAALDRTLGRPGKSNGGVYQFTFPRKEDITAGKMPAGASMGTGTAINFHGVGGGRTAVTGDFVLLVSEVDPVMRTLRSGGLEITALHTHMLDEEPRLFFMHFWGVGDAARTSQTLRAALALTDKR